MKIKVKVISIISSILLIFLLSINVSYAFAEGVYVYLGGFTCGFTINTKGATVVALTEVISEGKIVSPSKCAGIEAGDVIIKMNGREVNSASDIECVLDSYEGGFIVTELERNNVKKLVDIFPEKDLTGKYKIGVFIKNDLNGLGTVTFLSENGDFASLGHPVSNEFGDNYKVVGGKVYRSSIIGTVKATRGHAGELRGMFIGEKPIGTITKNTNEGMYGKFENVKDFNCLKICTAKAQIGKAKIFSTIDGETPKYYDIEIVKTDFRKNFNKNLVIKITDKELLEKTGGILQGMSGSPIVQDEKLVGAVTHVFLNDSSRGFGIAIDNMLENLNK